MTSSLYYSCSSANKQTRFNVYGIERASRLDRFANFAFTSKVSVVWSITSKDRFPSANINVILTYLTKLSGGGGGVSVGGIEEETVLSHSLSRA